ITCNYNKVHESYFHANFNFSDPLFIFGYHKLFKHDNGHYKCCDIGVLDIRQPALVEKIYSAKYNRALDSIEDQNIEYALMDKDIMIVQTFDDSRESFKSHGKRNICNQSQISIYNACYGV